MARELHVIFGTGPVGCWTARALCASGVAVRAVNRSGRRPALMPAAVEVVAADVADAAQAVEVAQGATVVYQALNPPYHLWQARFPTLQANALAAARRAGARYVSIENLYMYDPAAGPIREDSPIRPRTEKGVLRAEMAQAVMAAHRRGEVQATALRSSDYYGPGVREAALGARVFGQLVTAGRAQVLGRLDVPHAWAYIEDVGRAAAVLGRRDEALGAAWIAPHAPPRSQGEMIASAGRHLGIEPKVMAIAPWMLRLVGLCSPQARAAVEMMYQFTAPFVVDSQRIQRTFDLQPTAIDTGIRRTLAWFAEQG